LAGKQRRAFANKIETIRLKMRESGDFSIQTFTSESMLVKVCMEKPLFFNVPAHVCKRTFKKTSWKAMKFFVGNRMHAVKRLQV